MSEGKEIVIYDRGKVVRQDIEKALPSDVEAILNFVRQDDIAISLRTIEKSLQRRQIQGHKSTMTLNATEQVQFLDVINTAPYFPWATVRIVNNGPSPVYIAVNDNYDFTRVWVNTEFPLDYTEADERIHLIAYKCDAGGTASIQLVATY